MYYKEYVIIPSRELNQQNYNAREKEEIRFGAGYTFKNTRWTYI